ncbi:MAG: hypothetical protein LBP87_13340 [Planctomycetaceae bacterium]|jgi:hypothetical protein|nr:hypothetical protein [Planctomycetaceae bacterium]
MTDLIIATFPGKAASSGKLGVNNKSISNEATEYFQNLLGNNKTIGNF